MTGVNQPSEKKIHFTCFGFSNLELGQELHVYETKVIHSTKHDKLSGECRQANQPAPSSIGEWNSHFRLFFHRFFSAGNHLGGEVVWRAPRSVISPRSPVTAQSRADSPLPVDL